MNTTLSIPALGRMLGTINLRSPAALRAGFVALLAWPAFLFSMASVATTDLNPVPAYVWFGTVEWWLLVGPVFFGPVWPLAVVALACRLRWLPERSNRAVALDGLLVVIFNVASLCLFAWLGAARLIS